MVLRPPSNPGTSRGKLNVEGSAAAVVAPAVPLRGSSLAALLAGHILQDGEIVLLILKPSLWFLVLSSLPFAAVVSILIMWLLIATNQSRPETVAYVEAALVLIAGRVAWAILQWMGRFYILTDLRILRLGGVFSIEIFDCPLRKFARTRVVASTLERLVRTGSIDVVPQEGSWALGHWQTIGQPREVHEQIVGAINRAKQGGFPCP
jgi:hypothetical protein